MASNEFSLWYHNIPQMTKYWFTGSVILPLLTRFRILRPDYLYLNFTFTFRYLQLWRPVTAVLYYPLGYNWLINLYFLYNYSSKLERGASFVGRPANYLFLLIFNWFCLVIIGLFADIFLLMDSMVLSVLYIWCQLNRDVVITFWFGIRFKAIYLPWVLVGYNFIISSGDIFDLLGILVGHLYYWGMYIYPRGMGRASFIRTPDILYKWFPNTRMMGGFGQPSSGRTRDDGEDRDEGAVPRPRGWGTGQRLDG